MNKVCKICGKEYEACKNKSTGAFRWRDVACCVEHGVEYFAKVESVRNKSEDVIETEIEVDNVEDFEDEEEM